MKQTKNERVKEIRTQLNLTQAQLCQRLNITLATLSRIENGGYDLSSKIERAILESLGVDKEWFDTGKGKAFPSGKPDIIESNSYSSNPWKDEAYETVKRENDFLKKQTEWLQNLVNNLTQKGTNPNFLKASDVAGIPLYLLNKAGYSVANAQC